MENANPSCSTSNKEFLDLKKKKEIESWLEYSTIIDSLDVSSEIEYFNTVPTLEELEYHEQHYNGIMNKGLESRQKPSNPSKSSNFVGRITTRRSSFGKPFSRNASLVYDQEEGTITFKKDDEKITFKMPHKIEAFNHIDFKDIKTDSIPPFVLGSNDDRGKTYYSDSLTLGPSTEKTKV
ncbi:hypothetical protein Tco_1441165 [Tanacetum coccineum]